MKNKLKQILMLMSLTLCLALVGCNGNDKYDNLDIRSYDKETNEITELNYDDMYITVINKDGKEDKIEMGMLPEDVTSILGEPDSIEDSRVDKSMFEGKGFLYGDYMGYNYDDLYLMFYDNDVNDNDDTFTLLSVVCNGEKATGPRGIKVGDNYYKIAKKFPVDNSHVDPTIYYGDEAFGTIIYGGLFNGDFDDENVVGEYATAFKSNANEYDGESYVSYSYYKPETPDARLTSTSECCELLLTLLPDETVKSFGWSFNPRLQ